MKPFNLTDWQNGKPVVTRHGKEVKQLTFFPDVMLLAGIVGFQFQTFNIEGKFNYPNISVLDLFHPEQELPERGDVVWVRDGENDKWECKQFMFNNAHGYRATSFNPFNDKDGDYFKYLTTENPYKYVSK